MNVIVLRREEKQIEDICRHLVNIDESIVICGGFTSISSAAIWLISNPAPDLIISDVELPDGSYYDLHKRTGDMGVPVIFTTAFGDREFKLYDTIGVDFLPHNPEKALLALALERISSGSRKANTRFLKKTNKKNICILLCRYRALIIPVKISTIDCFLFEDGVTNVYVGDNKYEISHSLSRLEDMLTECRFFRVNRQCLVSKSAVEYAEMYYGRKLMVKIKNPVVQSLIIGKERAPLFLRWLESCEEERCD